MRSNERTIYLTSAHKPAATPLPSWGHFRARASKLSALFDHLVGAGEQRRRHFEAERFGGLQIDHQFVFGRLHDRQFCWIRALKNLCNVFSGLAIHPADAGTIAQERTRRCELPYETHKWELVPIGELDDLFASIQRNWIGSGDDSVGIGTQQLLECGVDFACVSGIEGDGF